MKGNEANKKVLVAHLNKIIEEAIYHGGDAGGPYCSNEEDLVEAMNRFRVWMGLSDYIVVETEFGFAYAKPAKEGDGDG